MTRRQQCIGRRSCGLRKAWRTLLLAACAGLPAAVPAGEWSGYVASEIRLFRHDPADPQQHNGANLSFAGEPEYYAAWDDGQQSFTFQPFARWDQHDSKRTHADLREMFWQKAADTWELRVGFNKVFWGVAESQHLVDIINQTDLVENIDLEDKLGQPMINLALISDWGTVDLFVLPWFRERTFPGKQGRLRTIPRVDVNDPEYSSSREKKHIDLAARWSHYLGDWDIGLAHFYGTTREPRLIPQVSATGRLQVYTPLYEIIHQTSIDVQATKGEWLWKLEALTRRGQEKRFNAMVGGFEYTWVGAFETVVDLGFIAEYHRDSRNELAPTPFEDDSMVGLRLALNDTQSTEALFGIIRDNDGDALTYNLEASRRLGESWVLELEARFFTKISPGDPLYGFRDDDYVQFTLQRYF
jgi:hypothetical protein